MREGKRMIRGSQRKTLGGDSQSVFLLIFTGKPVKILRFYIMQRFYREAKWKEERREERRRRREMEKEKFFSVLFSAARTTTLTGEKLNLHIECNQTPTGCLKMVFRAFDRKRRRRRQATVREAEKWEKKYSRVHFSSFFSSAFVSFYGTTWRFQSHWHCFCPILSFLFAPR